MKWEYKSASIKAAEVELDEKFNLFGEQGWEVYHITDAGNIGINEISSKGNGLKIFFVQMKRLKENGTT